VSPAMTEAGTRLARGRRYGILAYGSFGIMLGIALAVAGSILVGLSVSIFLAGFGFVASDLELSTGAMMVSGLVVGVAGAFCLGLASEGPLGRGRRLVGYETWEIGLGRIVAAFVIGLIAYLVHGFLVDYVTDLPQPIQQANEVVRAVGVAGMVAMPLLGVPLSMAIRYAPWEEGSWLKRLETPVMFVVWAVAALVIL
jgi:hypothetical protein